MNGSNYYINGSDYNSGNGGASNYNNTSNYTNFNSNDNNDNHPYAYPHNSGSGGSVQTPLGNAFHHYNSGPASDTANTPNSALPYVQPVQMSGSDGGSSPYPATPGGSGQRSGSTSGGGGGGHAATYDMQLPPEALGAHELVDFVFLGPMPNKPKSALSPPGVKCQPIASEEGMPLPQGTEPVSERTGRRLVYLGRGMAPVSVRAEPRRRFVWIALKGPGVDAARGVYQSCYGTILGYSDDNTEIIWHNRSQRFASRLPLSAILYIRRAEAMQCRHCDCVLLRFEMGAHMRTHKKGAGVEWGVYSGSESNEVHFACGDTGLLLHMQKVRPLGEGAQGVVELYRVTQPDSRSTCHQLPGTLKEVVVKTMRFEDSTDAWQQYQQSVRFMAAMDHPHLVEYLAVQIMHDEHAVRLVMPYYNEGDIAKIIRDFRGDHFEENFVTSVALQLSEAIMFLHERNPPIVHGDIKVENVMLYNRHNQIVLMDLDASREVKTTERAVRSDLGTTAYMAPETLNNERLMPASDMWSLGVFLYVMTVLPDFPMILNPVTNNLDMLNSLTWASADDIRALNEFAEVSYTGPGRSAAFNVSSAAGAGRMSLRDCVHANVRRKGFSEGLTELICDLLSYNPFKRPTAAQVNDRLTELMTNALLGDC